MAIGQQNWAAGFISSKTTHAVQPLTPVVLFSQSPRVAVLPFHPHEPLQDS